MGSNVDPVVWILEKTGFYGEVCYDMNIVASPERDKKEDEQRLYILPLSLDGRYKRFFLVGADGREGHHAFDVALRGIEGVKDRCKNFEEFTVAVVAHFKKAGFDRVAH